MSKNEPNVASRHFRFGWWALLFFLSMGIFLEFLHGFKIGAYVDVSSQTRREMWILSHAHGTLLALVNLAFALTLKVLSLEKVRWTRLSSATLLAGAIFIPGGFFLGGLFFWRGDPGLGILLVPLGGAMLLISVYMTARGVGAALRE
ncbi:MAG: hypothetical protein VX252_08110 [Myxococcota bacterium]|nr:hypothetical protein [Myxococcota bacterium]